MKLSAKAEGEYGGKGKFELPDSHVMGTVVPKGGSMCANCKYAGEDGKHCTNEYWVQWNGGDEKLPAPGDEYCCDVWEAA